MLACASAAGAKIAPVDYTVALLNMALNASSEARLRGRRVAQIELSATKSFVVAPFLYMIG